MLPVTNYCPDQKKFTPCQTKLPLRRYCIHQEESGISSVNTPPPAAGFLLSGASGLLGTALRNSLTARNSFVLQLVRDTPTAPNQLQWDPFAAAIPHSESLEDFQAAIHLSGANLGAHRWTPEYKRKIAESRIDSTRTLATALAGLRHPPKVLLTASAVGIYGNRGDELLDETSPPGSGHLADLCKRWEAATQPAVDAGIRVLHLRFGMVLGPGSGSALARLLPAFRLGLGALLGNGRQYMSWISLPDVLAAILFLLESPYLAGPVNLTAPNPVTNDQFTHTLAAQLHRPAFFSVPAFALRLAFGEMADETLLSSTRAYPAKLAAAGFQFTYPSLIHALQAILG